jgi:hypothetical protein
MGHQKLLLVVRFSGQAFLALSPEFGAMTKALPDIFPAFRTQSRTVFGTKRIFREVDQYDFPNPGNEVDQASVSILLVLGISRTALFPVQKMSVFTDRSPYAKHFQTPHTRNVQRVFDTGKDIDLCTVPADRPFNLKRFSLQRRVFERACRQTHRKRVFRSASLVRHPVDLEPEFQNS